MKILDRDHGALYQLYGIGYRVGDNFPIHGPHDTYGVVVKVIKETKNGTLYLVRGTRLRKYGNK